VHKYAEVYHGKRIAVLREDQSTSILEELRHLANEPYQGSSVRIRFRVQKVRDIPDNFDLESEAADPFFLVTLRKPEGGKT
jgi:hypothetical protein